MLIGGLGMGFTLRATLEDSEFRLQQDATVVVAELVPAVVEWNHGALGPLAEHPRKVTRTRVEIVDVAREKPTKPRPIRSRGDSWTRSSCPAAFDRPNNARVGAARVAASRASLKS